MDSAGSEFGLSDQLRGYFGTIFMFGMLFGSYFGGLLSDKYGRMFIFKKNPWINIVGIILLIVSVNPIMIYCFVFIFGVGTGGEITLGGVVF